MSLSSERNNDIEGKMELRHDPVPPFKAILFVALSIGVIYLGIIFLFSR